MSEADTVPGNREEIWLEKYRPDRLADIAGQETIVERLQSYVERDDLPHLLFAGPAGVGKCVTGETPVLTTDGLTRIDDVVGEREGFAENEAGTEVLTFTRDGEFEYVEPSHVFGKTAKEAVSVQTRDGADLTVTPEHRFLVLTRDGLTWRESRNLGSGDRIVRPLSVPLPPEESELDWVDAMDGERTFVHVSEQFAKRHGIPFEENLVGVKKDEDLDAPSTICSLAYLRDLGLSRDDLRTHVRAIQYVTTNNRRSEPISPPCELTPQLGQLLGLAISEAAIDGGRVKFYNTDSELIERFEQLLCDLFGVDPRTGTQQGVPYVTVSNRTLTHYLESCFDVFDSAMGGDGIGSAILRADGDTRRAFLRAVFDAEGYVSPTGHIELTQKNGDHITLLSYLLASFGIPSRRTTEKKAATNGSGIQQTYHTLSISSASHVRRFRETVGFTLGTKAARLETACQRTSNPNNDTVPTQNAVGELCDRLALDKTDYIPKTLNPESPGRERYLRGVSSLLDAATARLEAIQEARETLVRLGPILTEIETVPVSWAEKRARLEPLETRAEISSRMGIREDHLLEYARGNRVPYADRARTLLAEMTDELADPSAESPVEALQSELHKIIESVNAPYEWIAAETDLRGPDVANLLKRDTHEIGSLPRFATVADRLDDTLSEMSSLRTLELLNTLHVLVESPIYVDEVETVETVTEERRVYDLTVPDTRNYVAGTVPTVMHNTTCAIAVARELYGAEWNEHFLELNASDERGIDVVRDRIKSFARTSFGGVDHRIIFLDEADALCLPPGTEVVTGYPSSPEVKKIEDVDEDGEPIPSVDFETNEIQSDTGKLVDSGVADFFELEVEDGRTMLASLTHPFFVVGPDGKLVEKELRDLSPGDRIADFKDDVEVSRCDICGDWTPGRFCSLACKNEGHSLEMQGEGNPMYGTEWSDEDERSRIIEKSTESCDYPVTDITGDNNPMRDPEVAQKVSEALQGHEPTGGNIRYSDELGHLVRSDWEYEVAKALQDAGVEYEYEPEFQLSDSVFHPDFLIGDTVVEVKGVAELWGQTEKVEEFLEMYGEDYRFVVVGDEELPHHEHCDREEFEATLVSDGGPRSVQTVEVCRIEYSHRGKAYNISMDGTPNFMLGNGILTHNTSDAQSALRRTMEQFSNNVRFILSCNYSSQIIDPIQSRCAVFRFSPLSDDAVGEQVRRIAATESIELTDDGVDALVYAADGDMRKAINGLQAAAVTGGVVDEEAVFEITSTARPADIREMVTLALDGDFTAARSRLDELITEEGIAGDDIVDQLHRSVWEFDLDDRAAVRLLDRIGEADYRITEGANERIQLEALLASLALDE